MSDAASYGGSRTRDRALVTTVWCVGAAVLFGVFAALAVVTAAPIVFTLVCAGIAVALGLVAASAVRAFRR